MSENLANKAPQSAEFIEMTKGGPSEGDGAARRVTLFGAIGNLGLTAGKFFVGISANSAALVADAVHSASDLVSDLVVWVAIFFGSRDADENHPYGHRRFETMATLVVAILIIITAGVVIQSAILRLDVAVNEIPGILALYVALISIIVKEVMYRGTIRVANKYDLPLMRANAYHHRSDALSSIAAFVGIAGAINGIAILDVVAALIVGLMLLRVGIKLAWEAILEMSDIGVDEETMAVIEELINNEPDVESLHLLKTRHIGGQVLCEVHIEVPERLSVTEGHQVAERVRKTIITEVEKVSDVTVHVDPEDDEEGTTILPRRQELLKIVDEIKGNYSEISIVGRPTFHMLLSGCEVEVVVGISGSLPSITAIAGDFKTAIESDTNFVKADVVLALDI